MTAIFNIMLSAILFTIGILVLLFTLYVLIRPIIRGAIYFPTRKEGIETMVRLAEIKPGQKLVDIGSGDGRILIAFAQQGIESHGYEINPLLVLISKIKIRRAGLQDKAFVHWRSFWKIDFSRFDVITIYGFPRIMASLGEKLKRELRPGTKIISNVYRFPQFVPAKTEGKIYLYVV